MRTIIGGIGGGGDVGLALILAADVLRGNEIIVASFSRCSSKHFPSEKVRAALVRPAKGINYGPRFFEDKLVRLGISREKIYVICTKDSFENIVEGVEHLFSTANPDAVLYTDIGGDALLLGYESYLGSYITDTVARAALSKVATSHGLKPMLGIGAIGAEGGGGYLDMEELVAGLVYLDEIGVVLGGYVPNQEAAWPAWELLNYTESGMLRLYLTALSGRVGEARINSAYLKGRAVQLMPHHKYIVLLDTVRHCSASPICTSAIKGGREHLRAWERPRPPSKYLQILRRVKAVGWAGTLNELLSSKKLSRVTDLLKLLTIGTA